MRWFNISKVAVLLALLLITREVVARLKSNTNKMSNKNKSKTKTSSRFRSKLDEEGELQEKKSDAGTADGSAFNEIAKFLSRSKFTGHVGNDEDVVDDNIKDFSVKDIEKAVKSIAGGQIAFKSLDGVTHSFRNTFKESSSLASRFEKFVSTGSIKKKSKSKKSKKEAGKLEEYTSTVERAMQASEVLQSISVLESGQRSAFLEAAGLVEISRVKIRENKIGCIVSVLIPCEDNDYFLASTMGNSDSSVKDTSKVSSSESSKDELRTSAGSQSTSLKPPGIEQATTNSSRIQRSRPQKYLPGELVIAIVDDARDSDAGAHTDGGSVAVAKLLRLISKESPELVSLSSVGFTQEEVSVQPTLFSLAKKVISHVETFLLPTPPLPLSSITDTVPRGMLDGDGRGGEQSEVRCVSEIPKDLVSIETAAAAKRKKKNQDANKKRIKANMKSKSIRNQSSSGSSSSSGINNQAVSDEIVGQAESQAHRVVDGDKYSLSGRPVPCCIRVIGHSAGAAVGAYAAMMLDGSLRLSSEGDGGEKDVCGDTGDGNADSGVENAYTDLEDGDGEHQKSESIACSGSIGDINGSSDSSESSGSMNRSNGKQRGLQGLYLDNVKCVCIAPPPCISRTLVPPFVASIVCGDDVIPRCSVSALATLRKRVSEALKWAKSSSVIDVMTNPFRKGSGMLSDLTGIAGKSFGHYTGTQHDLASLSIPGRVFYAKSRKFKDGATIQRIMRGNWQEDVLWQIHEILLSPKMLEHHSLQYYIQTLNRC